MHTDESVSRTIAAPAASVWEMVSDLPRMGEWSNENVGGRWIGEPSAAVTGAVFKGENRNGIHRWSTKVRVVEAVPGETFRFEVTALGLPVSMWSYDFEETADGCRVTESWTDRRPAWFAPLARIATGVADRSEHTRAGMAHTLDRLARAAEAGD